MGGSWVRIITSPFRKACSSLFNSPNRDRSSKSQSTTAAADADADADADAGHHKTDDDDDDDEHGMILHGEVMACGYEDVRVMWSILDSSNHQPHRTCGARNCTGGA